MKRSWLWMVVIMVLTLIGAAGVLAQDDMVDTVGLGGNDDLGTFLVGGESGMTLYTFTRDEPGVSNCVDQCATNWPPLTVDEGVQPTLAEGISGRLGVIARADGTRQVTYNGWPLYFWVNDAAAGDATGQGVNDVWFVAAMPTVGLGGNDSLGTFLVGANGMTLYTFARDEGGASACYDQCATNWPPLTVADVDALSVQPGIPGEFGVAERTDGTQQVTFNGWPLYGWINDAAPGDSTGHLVNDVWFAAAPPTLSAVDSEEFGQILVGPDGMTLYTFANDTAGTSACVDGCAVAWPPLMAGADGDPVAAEGLMGEVGTIERADGSMQVTYNGMPLYGWINDVIPGDTTGHNFRDVWFVAVP
jgi:predicted lipoprotein with Yx(FWY)xxD motif